MGKIALLSLCLISDMVLSQGLSPADSIAALRFSPQCILEAVAKKMNVTLDSKIEQPKIIFTSSASLTDFQDAVEKQWGFRPNALTNVFVQDRNEIYLLDGAEYYQRVHRFMDDSLAHEFVHFIQDRYQNADLADESLEYEAIDVQTWFRDTYMLGSATCN